METTPLQSSVAVAVPNAGLVSGSRLAVHARVMSAGQVITGAVLSNTVMT